MAKRTTTRNVPHMWANGLPAKGGALTTDGTNLYSYRLCIGTTTPTGEKVLHHYTADYGVFQSMTTSKHVGYARMHCDSVVDPHTGVFVG